MTASHGDEHPLGSVRADYSACLVEVGSKLASLDNWSLINPMPDTWFKGLVTETTMTSAPFPNVGKR